MLQNNEEQTRLLNILMKRKNISYLESCGGSMRLFNNNENEIAKFIDFNENGNLYYDENKRLEKEFANYHLQDIPNYWFEKYFELNNNEQKLKNNFLACIIRNPLIIRSNIQKEPILVVGYISNNIGVEEIYALIVILNEDDGFYLLPNVKPNGNLNYLSSMIRDLNYRNLHFNDYFVFKYFPIQIDNKLMKYAISSTSAYFNKKKESLSDKNLIRKYNNEIFILDKILSDIVKIEQSHIRDIYNFNNKINSITEFNINDLDTIYCLERIFNLIIKTSINYSINNN
jgi:hypothetical protein